jgi:hypothetical protein
VEDASTSRRWSGGREPPWRPRPRRRPLAPWRPRSLAPPWRPRPRRRWSRWIRAWISACSGDGEEQRDEGGGAVLRRLRAEEGGSDRRNGYAVGEGSYWVPLSRTVYHLNQRMGIAFGSPRLEIVLLCLLVVSVCNTVCFTGCPGEGDPHRRVERSAG